MTLQGCDEDCMKNMQSKYTWSMFSNMRVYNAQSMPLLQMRMSAAKPVKKVEVPTVNDQVVAQEEAKKKQEEAKKKQEEDRKRTSWGHPIWLLFHSLAYKIKEESFPLVGHELLRLIHGIATNLPCPVCSDHAREYMKNINFLAIQTKQQFINFLFQFHNSVNARKGYPLFPREEVDKKYATAILPAIFARFEQVYRDKSYNPQHIHDEYIRNRILKQMRDWFQRHYSTHFN